MHKQQCLNSDLALNGPQIIYVSSDHTLKIKKDIKSLVEV